MRQKNIKLYGYAMQEYIDESFWQGVPESSRSLRFTVDGPSL